MGEFGSITFWTLTVSVETTPPMLPVDDGRNPTKEQSNNKPTECGLYCVLLLVVDHLGCPLLLVVQFVGNLTNPSTQQ